VKEARIGVCDRCGAEHFAARETNRWEEQFEAEHTKHYMQPKEIRELQQALGTTMEQFAFLIGCTRQSLYNWQRRDRRKPQSRMADVFMKLVRESHAKGKVDVLQFLIGEARRFGIEIKLGASNGDANKSPIILHAIRMSPAAFNSRMVEPVQLAADTTEEEPIVALVSEEDDPVGMLSYDFGTASLDLELKKPLGFDQFDATIRFNDGEVAKIEAVKVKGQWVRLLAETNRTEEDVREVVLTPRDK
jgi:DNA-binding transcriptional regulator YiaG